MKKVAFFFLFLVLAVFLFVRSLLHSDLQLSTLWSQTSTLLILAFLVVSFGNFAVGIWRWRTIIRTQNHYPPCWRLCLHGMAGYTMSYLTPATLLSGEPVRIYLLMEKEKHSGSQATASVLVDKLLEIFSLIIFIVIATGILLTRIDNQSLWIMEVVLLLTATAGTYIFYRAILSPGGFFTRIFRWLKFHRFRWGQLIEAKIVKTEHLMRTFFADHRPALWAALWWGLLFWFLHIFEFWLIFLALGAHISFEAAFLISTIPMVTFMLPIPAGLGAFETGLVITCGFLGINPVYALPVALLNRFRDILFVTIGLIHSGHTGVNLWLKQRQSVT